MRNEEGFKRRRERRMAKEEENWDIDPQASFSCPAEALCCVVLAAAKGLHAQGSAIVMEALQGSSSPRVVSCVGMKCFAHANRHDTKFVFQEPSKNTGLCMCRGILAFITRIEEFSSYSLQPCMDSFLY